MRGLCVNLNRFRFHHECQHGVRFARGEAERRLRREARAFPGDTVDAFEVDRELLQSLIELGALQLGDRPFGPGLSAFAVLGGVRRATNAQDFKRGDAFAFMGGCELDLREASMKDDEAVFDIFALMGGVEMRVPEDWVVDNRGFALLGGFVDKTRPVRDAKKRLVLTGLAVMGGVEVKN